MLLGKERLRRRHSRDAFHAQGGRYWLGVVRLRRDALEGCLSLTAAVKSSNGKRVGQKR